MLASGEGNPWAIVCGNRRIRCGARACGARDEPRARRAPNLVERETKGNDMPRVMIEWEESSVRDPDSGDIRTVYSASVIDDLEQSGAFTQGTLKDLQNLAYLAISERAG